MLRRAMDGVFAVSKPSGPSSAEVLDKLKYYFSSSPVFAESIKNQNQRDRKSHNKWKRAKRDSSKVKIGHGGTLDPLASGVMVVGIGSGTKQLQQYLGNCTKTYRATLLFGASTTTYDSQGSVLVRAPTAHLTTEIIKEAVKQFEGTIKQTPPVFSALKMDGKPLYEYARSGQSLPRPIEKRECTVDSLQVIGELVSEHEYEIPNIDATAEEKLYAKNIANGVTSASESGPEAANSASADSEDVERTENGDAAPDAAPEAPGSTATVPIIEIRVTVSSGTYIRTLIDDIGKAAGSQAHMVKLVREAQGQWTLEKNTFELADFFDRDSSKWEPELSHVLKHGPKTSLKDLRAPELDSVQP